VGLGNRERRKWDSASGNAPFAGERPPRPRVLVGDRLHGTTRRHWSSYIYMLSLLSVAAGTRSTRSTDRRLVRTGIHMIHAAINDFRALRLLRALIATFGTLFATISTLIAASGTLITVISTLIATISTLIAASGTLITVISTLIATISTLIAASSTLVAKIGTHHLLLAKLHHRESLLEVRLQPRGLRLRPLDARHQLGHAARAVCGVCMPQSVGRQPVAGRGMDGVSIRSALVGGKAFQSGSPEHVGRTGGGLLDCEQQIFLLLLHQSRSGIRWGDEGRGEDRTDGFGHISAALPAAAR
jgi:hypothetical protein